MIRALKARITSPKKKIRGVTVKPKGNGDTQKNENRNIQLDNSMSKGDSLTRNNESPSSASDMNSTNDWPTSSTNELSLDTDNIDSDGLEISHQPLSPPLSPASILKLYPGYTGHYKGKVVPVVGRSEFPISIPSHLDDGNSPVKSFQKRPRTSPGPVTYTTKDHVKLLIKDIQSKINERYPKFVEKRLHVKHIFQLYDHERRGYVSVTDLRICLTKLCIGLNSRDMQPLIDTYRGSAPEQFLYMKFLEDICGPGIVDHQF